MEGPSQRMDHPFLCDVTQWGLHITFVDIFASFDKWLEDAGVLPRLNKADSIEDPAAFEQARAIRKKLRKLRLSNSRVAQRERWGPERHDMRYQWSGPARASPVSVPLVPYPRDAGIARRPAWAPRACPCPSRSSTRSCAYSWTCCSTRGLSSDSGSWRRWPGCPTSATPRCCTCMRAWGGGARAPSSARVSRAHG